MSEEEKIAIETLKEVASDDFDTLGDDISPKMAQTILNFIKKLQKEIEHELDQRKYWRDNFYKQQKEIEELKNNELDYTTIYINGVYEGKKYYKDKIREKIKHYNNELEHIKNGEEFENEKPMYYWGKAALEELLEEKQ